MSSPLREFSQQQLLVDGYTRTNFIYSIPIALVKLILLFYNDIFYWRFKDKKLKQFLSKPFGGSGCICSFPFKINNIEFIYHVYPNGMLDDEKGYVQFGYSITSMSEVIDFVIIHCILYCKELDILFIGSQKKDISISNSFGWNIHLMKLSHCADKPKLNFVCKLNVLKIKLKDTLKPNHKHKLCAFHAPDIKMNKSINFEWKFSGKTLTKWKSNFNDDSKEIDFYSPYFDDKNWILSCHQDRDEKDEFCLYLHLCQLPEKIKQISVSIKISFRCDGHKNVTETVETKRKWGFHNINRAKGAAFSFDAETLLKMSELSFVVKIDISKIFDFQDNEIKERMWGEFGVNNTNDD